MDSNSNKTKSIKLKLVDQLLEGYDFTTQLQLLLDQTRLVSGSGSVSYDQDLIDELIAKILRSFCKTISDLDSFDHVSGENSLNASCGGDLSAAPVSCNGGDTGDSKKILGVRKGKRGCYTRKKRSHSRIVEAKSIEDGFAWRKYGQKHILNTNFPRSYFRCTHKPTQGCKATKQVQKQEQDPQKFQITYIGHHTCTANYNQTHTKTEPFDHEIIIDSDKTLAATTARTHENNMMVARQGVDKEEEYNNGDNKECFEGSSTCEDLSLVWQDMMMMFDDHDQQNYYHYGETSINTSHPFGFHRQ